MRVWDGLVFEDEEEDKTEIGVEASGALDESQTRQVLHRSGFVQLAVYLFFGVSPFERFFEAIQGSASAASQTCLAPFNVRLALSRKPLARFLLPTAFRQK